MYRSGRDGWAPQLMVSRPDVDQATVDRYLHNLYRVNPDFLYSVSRDFMAGCETPILVLPDDVPAHPHQTSIDVASLAPNAEITVFPWTSPPELKARTVERRWFDRRLERVHGAIVIEEGGGAPWAMRPAR